LVLENVTIPGRGSTLHGAVLDAIDDGEGEIRFVAVDSENTTLSVGDRLFLKFYRRLEDGTNPELEVGRHLAACDPPAPTPRLLGYLEQRFRVGEPRTIATLFAYVANEGSAAVQAREEVGRFVERILVESPTSGPEPIPNVPRSEEHTSELQSRENLVCRLLLEKKKNHKNARFEQYTRKQIWISEITNLLRNKLEPKTLLQEN